ncbi:hypothetical protein [Gluconacetobacter takamatsuzukensis]|uniref:Glycine zipper domain-containing protein n=1 Tax=Gluconacetobacter takamatsuzukensis TaxID=1286190 RepID=A0A7W4KGE3_9PROT|nr:hypothetical protein [Gluconacetobacter takamatsuzukensis]MBB2206418.1 hypothetical protein [Gluconacetobacter takamatsuzukensis]
MLEKFSYSGNRQMNYRCGKLPLAAIAGCMLLSACAAPAYDSSVSPEENQLRQRQAQFNTTVGEGAALVGGLAALGVGLATHSAANAAIAGAGGALVGGAIGYAVASRTQAQQMSEDGANKAIVHYREEVVQSQQDATAAEQTTAKAQQDLVVLRQKLAANQISAADYQAKIANYRRDIAAMQAVQTHYTQTAASAQNIATGRKNAEAATISTTLNAQNARISKAVDELTADVGAMPAASASPVVS